LLPGKEQLKFAQLPGVRLEEQREAGDIGEFVEALEEKGDGRVMDVKKALQGWGRLELVDASFKVIGERLVTPSSIVYLIVKLRLSPSRGSSLSLPPTQEKDAEETKRSLKSNEDKDNQFLVSRKDAEDNPSVDIASGWAHAPYWPGYRKPAWWLVLADDKTNRVVVPPMKITDVPFSKPEQDRNFRSYKLQFQAPNGVGLFTWKIYLVSDTFVGEEICEDIALKIDDITALNADEQGAEDEISDPEEDSLAGQMAAMRGGSVKKVQDYNESDEESSTDDDQESGSSNSDSDSD
jgi:translocation protein SEC63